MDVPTRRSAVALAAAGAALLAGCAAPTPEITVVDDAGTRLFLAPSPWEQREGESSGLLTGTLEVSEGGCLVVDDGAVGVPDHTSLPLAFPSGSTLVRESDRVTGVRAPDGATVLLGDSRGWTGGRVLVDDLERDARDALTQCTTEQAVFVPLAEG